MDSNSYKTKYLNKESIQKNWYVADANDKTLGRFCSEVAKILRGKNKASFTPTWTVVIILLFLTLMVLS